MYNASPSGNDKCEVHIYWWDSFEVGLYEVRTHSQCITFSRYSSMEKQAGVAYWQGS